MCLMLIKHGVCSFIANDKLAAIFMRLYHGACDYRPYRRIYWLFFFLFSFMWSSKSIYYIRWMIVSWPTLNGHAYEKRAHKQVFISSIMGWCGKSIFGALWPHLPSIRTHVHHTSLNTIKTIIAFALVHMRFYAFSITFSKSQKRKWICCFGWRFFLSLSTCSSLWFSIHLHNIYIISDFVDG